MYDLIVIGAGPGGYVAAIRAAQLGFKVACVEKEAALGGTCLRVGCIPSKALLEESYRLAELRQNPPGLRLSGLEVDLPSLMAHKEKVVRANTEGVDYLFRKNQVTRYLGTARLLSPHRVRVEGPQGVEELEGQRILIATGSKSASLPGVEVDGQRVVTSTEALAFEEVPRRLLVIGGGIIGLELGSVWQRLGAQVVVLEYLPRILPGMDGELARQAERIFRKQGLEIRTGAKVVGARAEGEGAVVELEGGERLEGDRVLLAVGRVPYTEGLGLAELGLSLDAKGRIPVNKAFETAIPGLYAIGDVIQGPMLAHKASEEGVAAVERMAGHYARVDYQAIPNVVYTHPEVASVGMSEEELKAAGIAYTKGSFPFQANGRARTMGETEGFVKVLAEAKTDRILGVHILGPRAGDLIAEAALAIAFKASAEDVGRTPHAHPTLAEALKEAALDAYDRPIHI